MQPLKPGKDNTYGISGYYDIQNPRRYLASYIDIDIISILLPSPTYLPTGIGTTAIDLVDMFNVPRPLCTI